MNILETEGIAHKTFAQFGTERLNALSQAMEVRDRADPLLQVFRRLMRPWGRRPIGTVPRFASNVADDEAPFEFSVAFCRSAPELQVYVEAQGDPPSLQANMCAGRELLQTLAREFPIFLDRFRRVESLFFPEDPCGPFAIWIGASWTPGREPRFKAYLNPGIRGRDAAPEVVSEAMGRLGFDRAWRAVREILSHRGDRRDELGIVCLDLWDSQEARVKVYVRHCAATVSDIGAVARVAGDHRPDDVRRFYSCMAETEGPFLRKPPLTEFAFVDPDAERPESATLEFPIASYVEDDEDARLRIVRCLTAFGLPALPYEGAIRAFARRSLEDRPGIQEHVTLRRVRTEPRVGIYLASEAYSPRGGARR